MIAVTFPDADTESNGFAYAFSYDIIPFLSQIDSDFASLLTSNTPLVPGSDGVINVTISFNAMRTLVNSMPFINCADIVSFTYNGLVSDTPLPDFTASITFFGQPIAQMQQQNHR